MGSLPPEQRFRAHSICIVGAGPSGLAAAKYLLAENAFAKIVVFEQRSGVGGLWNHVPLDEWSSARLSVPQTDAHADLDKPTWTTKDGSRHLATFVSPVYDRLETNIPRGLMGFGELDWHQDLPLFPKHEQVLRYIAEYSQDVHHLIEFETQVVDIRRTDDESCWRVKSQKLVPASDGAFQEEMFDAIVVANGHYAVPYVPDIDGIKAFAEQYPGTITHSKFYRRPEQYTNKKVVIVGNAASGIDIGVQVASFCRAPVLVSQRSESYLSSGPAPNTQVKPEISEYIMDRRGVRFVDGTVEYDIDAIIYCTGYLYAFPFLKSLEVPVVSTGERVENLYQHIFYRPIPTLTFVGLNQKVIPFPVSEAQASVIARVLSGRLSLPAESEMAGWEHDRITEAGDGKAFLVLQYPRDAEYINMLHDWALSSDRSCSIPHADVEQRIGKPPPYWHEEQFWVRAKFPEIKRAYQALGERRYSIRTLREVGFDFRKRNEQ